MRFKQSLNGKFIIIVGKRKGPLEDRFYNKTINAREIQSGIFLYEVSLTNVKLVKAFLFAEKNPENIPEDIKAKINAPLKFNREYVEPEIKKRTIGEFDHSYLDEDGNHEYPYYDNYLQLKETDEEYIQKLREEKEAERLQKLALQQKNE